MVAKRGATPPAKRPRETEIENKVVSFAPAGVVGTAPRRVYDAAFKLHVVRHALSLPENNRHKPIARCYPGLTPVQVRKWIRNVAALESAVPTAKLILRNDEPACNAETPHSIPDYSSHHLQGVHSVSSQPTADHVWGGMSHAQHQPAMMGAPNADVYHDHLPSAFHQGRPAMRPATPPMTTLPHHPAHYLPHPSDGGHLGAPSSSFHFMHSMPPPYYAGHHHLQQPLHQPLYQGMHQGIPMGCLGAAPALPLHPNVGCGPVAPPISSGMGSSAPMPCRSLDNTLPSQMLGGHVGIAAHQPASAFLPSLGAAGPAEQSDDSVHKGKMKAALDLLNLCNGTGCSDESTAAVAPPLVM